jgi:putative colanic acid biosynthesis UDP-glucose lipid carrier transferase
MRIYFQGNLRNIIVVGSGDSATTLKNLFIKQKDLGYKLKAVFNNSKDPEVVGTIADSFSYLKQHPEIDEIYCAIDELTERDLNEYIRIANKNQCNIKFIPNTKKLVSKRLKTEYYQYTPVLSLEDIRLNDLGNQWIKRSFDIIFSLFIIIFVLSWLSVILYVLIKLESRGPLLYSHQRTGLNYKVFTCYKYRSMHITEEIQGTYVRPNDDRVTAIGKILRRTSLDELPQFINVLKGDMSVVGPRPHMLSYTEDYSKKINKYNFIYRHHVKPGITGLAQTRGYRGRVESDQDIIGRVKYDIFYIENWSLLLDLKIIAQTIINLIKGEEKAY